MHDTGATDAQDMAARIAAHPWATTPLGPRADWPQALKTLVETILVVPFPQILAWGPELTCVYNDAYRPLLGRKREALGRPFLDVWAEAADVVAPALDQVWQGHSTAASDFPFVLLRNGEPEEAFFDFSFSPVRDETGAVAGVLNVAVETTRRVASDRDRRESDMRLGAVLEQMPLGVALAALPSGALLYHNPKAVDLLGHPMLAAADTAGYACYGALHDDGTAYGPEEYPMARAVLGGETVDREIMRYRRGDGRETWFEVSAGRVHDSNGDPVLAVSTFHDIAARRAAEAALLDRGHRLRESERRLRSLIEGIPQLVWRAVDAGNWTWASPQWTEATGLDEADSHGHGWLQAVHPDDRETALAAWRSAGEAGHGFTLEARIGPPDGRAWRWYRTRATPVLDEAGGIVEWLGTCTDIDDLRRMQDQQGVMVAELQHRTRNLLAIVQSIATQTVGLSDSLESFESHFADRLAALSRVQGLLSAGDPETVTIGALVRLELDALAADLDGDRIACGGPEVPLRKRAVQTLSLALHELATNARKHGALSGPAGRLDVHWRIRDDDGEHRVVLDWTESGAPLPAATATSRHRGYGRRLIERALPYSLGARTEFVLDDRGLRCRIDLPLTLKDNREVAG
ncbi:PAS domain-containing protein [Caenispirillum bisanense]|uniref:histidine kinase n=1 Tax=Caenispirillum bisanense TaxID=414052 RepID=A0A286GLK3_9PROT|nr:PAS domain-containing protein [Caenispirillum bisanense]SOD96398.1 PAS domain S-box-containing protein [Caenispirillum bisanense]